MYENELRSKVNDIRMAAYTMNIAAMKCTESPEDMANFHEEDNWFSECCYELIQWVEEHYTINEEAFKKEEEA